MKGITVVFPALNGKSSSFHGKIKLFRTQASKFKEARVMIGWMHRSIQMFWRAKGTDEDCHQEGMRLLQVRFQGHFPAARPAECDDEGN
jgi:hypothetical protein